jgi:Protein of unknown function (DUF664)
VNAETETLLAYLKAQRRHVLGTLEGLDEAALRRPVLPSGWTCVGMVSHLAIDDECFWFRAVVAGEPAVIDMVNERSDAWHVADDVPVKDIIDLYRREAGLADAIIAAADLEREPAYWPSFFGEWRLDNVREVLLHVIAETACHAGHLDAARELLDGRQWMVVT